MSASDNEVSPTPTNTTKCVGVVKWFNNKAGFGFITMLDDGEHKNKDIFVHYTSIQVSNSQYKYLVKGEYVDFELVHTNTPGAEHEFYASAVSGIKGGLLMCETRHNEMASRPPAREYTPGSRLPRTNYVPKDAEEDVSREYRQRPARRDQGEDAPRQRPVRRDQGEDAPRQRPARRSNTADSEGFVRVERRRSAPRA